MDGQTVVVAALSGLVGAVGTSAVIWVATVRGQLTKKDHGVICEGKQTVIDVKFKGIEKKLDNMDEKLDRLLFNNRPPATTASRGDR